MPGDEKALSAKNFDEKYKWIGTTTKRIIQNVRRRALKSGSPTVSEYVPRFSFSQIMAEL